MRKIIAATFVSLDGVMQAPGGSEEDPVGGFRFGGWTFPYFTGDEKLGAALGEIFDRPFELLLGRRTYDIFAAHWPYAEAGPDASIATVFNATAKHVATRSPDRPLAWNNSHSLGRDVVASLRRLKQEDAPDLLIQGSSDLIQTLLANGLIDEFSLLVFPVVLGRGKRLFGEGVVPSALQLVRSEAFPSGVILARYQPAGEVRTGSFAPEQPSESELERRRNLA